MRRTLLAFAATAALTTAASAETIGVSMALFDDNFLTVLRNGMVEQAEGMEGVELQVEDAQNDVAKQLDQINNFIASGVDAIIVNPVDTSATQAMSDAAAAGGVPLVYVNREPINVDSLPDRPGLRRLERGRFRHARDQGGLPAPRRAGPDRGQHLRDDGRALQPGRRAAHRRHP